MYHKSWTNEEDAFLNANYKKLSKKELAKKLNRSEKAISKRMSLLFLNAPLQEYALYRGDELIATGTVKEIAEKEGVKEQTVRCYLTPSYKNRKRKSKVYRELIKIE